MTKGVRHQASGVRPCGEYSVSSACQFAICNLQFAICNLLARCTFSGIALLCCLALPVTAADDEAQYDLHEFSLWGLDPTLEQANELAHYPSAMPGVVDTDRSRANEARKLTPLSVITLHGEAVKDLEVDLRIQSGRFIGHWPPAESKSGRLRWLDLSTIGEADKDALFASVDDKHWFNDARRLDAMYVKDKSRSERFLTYDVELKYELPVQVTGGPDTYMITNSGKHPLLDLFVLSPQEDGVRIGRLDSLPPSKPKADAKPSEEKAAEGKPAEKTDTAKPDTAKPADEKPAAKTDTAKPDADKPDAEKPAEDKPTETQEAKPAAAQPAAAPAAAPVAVVVAAPAAAPVAVPVGVAPAAGGAVPAQPAAAPAAKPAVALEPTEIAMSPVAALDSDELRVVRETLSANLLKLGLTQQEIDLLFDRAGAAMFEPKEMIVLFRLPPEAIEERLPLVAYPAPRKTIRTALVVVRNIDPKIKDEVQKLIADLGSAEYTSREAAEKRLTELGRLAIPSLKVALKSGDLEIVFRAERILLAQNEKLEGT
jgi:hypothetical protein